MSEFNENNGMEQETATSTVSSVTENPAEAISAVTEVVGGAERAKKKPVLLIVAIIVLILGGASALAYNFLPWVKNNVKLLVSKPENYYAWVEEENIKTLADGISKGYGKALDSMAGQNGSEEVEIKADINVENCTALIEELSGSSLSESGVKLPSSIAIKSAGKKTDDGVDGAMLVNAGDKTLATMNIFMRDGAYYAQIPELSDAYISFDYEQLLEASMDNLNELDDESAAFVTGYIDTLKSFIKNPDSLREFLSEDELNEFIVKYFTIAFSNIDDVEIEKRTECDANGVEGKLTVITADVDMGTLYSIAKDVLKEAKKDKTIIKIVEKAGISADDYTSAVESLLDQFGNMEVSGGETIFKMNVYVDSKGVICGRSIEVPEEDVNIGYLVVKDGNETGVEASFMEGEDEGVKFLMKSEENSGKESGEAKIKAIGMDEGEPEEFPITFKDMEIVNEDKGYFKGEISIDFTPFEGPVLTLAFDSDGEGQTVKSDINVEGKEYGTVSISSKEKTSVEIPAFDSSKKVYAFTQDGAELQQYIMDCSGNLESFVNNIGSAFGVDGLGGLFSGAMGGNTAITDVDDDIFGTDDIDTAIEVPEPDDNTVMSNVSYDFNKLDFEINGQKVKIPSKINGITNLVKFEQDEVEANGYAYGYSEDYTFGINMKNPSSSKVKVADCEVTGISIANGALVKLNIDGFAPGSKIEEFAAKYGAKLDDPKNGSVTIVDTNSSWNTFSVYYYDGVIDSIYFDIIE